MEVKVTTLDGGEAGSLTLSDAIFGLEPRTDIIHRCVVWQLAKRQSGTHAVKNRADINRTGKKMYRQKGTGSARHGSARVNLFRGGGRSFGDTAQPTNGEVPHAGFPRDTRQMRCHHAARAAVAERLNQRDQERFTFVRRRGSRELVDEHERLARRSCQHVAQPYDLACERRQQSAGNAVVGSDTQPRDFIEESRLRSIGGNRKPKCGAEHDETARSQAYGLPTHVRPG